MKEVKEHSWLNGETYSMGRKGNGKGGSGKRNAKVHPYKQEGNK